MSKKSTHLTAWFGYDAKQIAKMSKREKAAIQGRYDTLVAFAKSRDLVIEDWSMFGDLRVTIDIEPGSGADALLETACALPDSLPPTHVSTFHADYSDMGSLDDLLAIAAELGINEQRI